MNRLWLGILGAGLLAACEEAPLIVNENDHLLNAPSAMAVIPGTSLAVVANANVNLAQEFGSLVAIDLDSREVLAETMISIRSFAARLAVDPAAQRIYVTDRGDDAILVFSYAVPGTSGEAISFSPVEVNDPRKEVSNGIRADEEPFDIVFSFGSARGDVVLATNQESGSLSVIPMSTLLPIDLNPDDGTLTGIPIVSAANFTERDNSPARGTSRMIPSYDGTLLYVPSTFSSQIYVIDRYDQATEAMIDLSEIAPAGGARGIAISSDGKAYIALRGIGGVIVLDIRGITENGIDEEVIDVPVLGRVVTGDAPEGVVLSADESKIFVSDVRENSVVMIDRESLTLLSRAYVSGSSPGEIYSDSDGRGVLYVMNFLSDNISVIDEANGLEIQVIQ